MTNNIFNLKKEIDNLKRNIEKIKWINNKNNIKLFICYLASIFLLNSVLDIKQLLSISFINGLILTGISLKMNISRIKEKKQLKLKMKEKEEQLNNEINREIKLKKYTSIKEINKSIEYNSLEEYVINQNLQKNYQKNIKRKIKIKKNNNK